MFETLTDKFNDAFRKLSGRGRITQANVREAMDEVRSALLEADVHYDVVQSFVSRHPDRFIPVAFVTPHYPDEAMEELDRCFGELGTKFLKIYPNYFGYNTDNYPPEQFSPSSSGATSAASR